MQLHQIKPIHKPKKKKRVGRGGKRGTYSGKGMKGQKSRAGAKIRPAWRDLLKQIPKQRGYKFKSIKDKPLIINYNLLERKFNDGDKITPENLFKKGLVKKYKGKMPKIKILDGRDAKKKFIIERCEMSESVKNKI